MSTMMRYADAACAVFFSAGLGVLIVDTAHREIEAAWDAAVRALTREGWDLDPDEPSMYEPDTQLEGYTLTR